MAKQSQGSGSWGYQNRRITVYIRRITLMWATLYRILIGLKWGSLVVFLARRRLKPTIFTEEWLEGVYAFTTTTHSLLLHRCTVTFKTQHLLALPFISPSSRVPAGISAARQKRVRTTKMYECEFHDAWCSRHAVYAWPWKHSKHLASTPHVEHLIPVAITARVQLKSPDGDAVQSQRSRSAIR